MAASLVLMMAPVPTIRHIAAVLSSLGMIVLSLTSNIAASSNMTVTFCTIGIVFVIHVRADKPVEVEGQEQQKELARNVGSCLKNSGMNSSQKIRRSHGQYFRIDPISKRITNVDDFTFPAPVALYQYLWKYYENFKDEKAIISAETGITYTHRQLRQHSLKFASALMDRGYKKKFVAASIMGNRPEFYIAFLGITIAGGISAPIPRQYNPDEIAFHLNLGEVDFVVTEQGTFSKVFEAIRHSNRKIEDIFVVGDPPSGGISFWETVDSGTDAGTLERAPVVDDPKVDFVVTEQGTFSKVFEAIRHSNRKIEDIFVVGDPPSGGISFWETVDSGTDAGTLERAPVVDDPKPHILPVVPALVHYMIIDPRITKETMSHVIIVVSGAAPLPRATAKRFQKMCDNDNMIFFEAYGLSETSPVALCQPPDAVKWGSCGGPLLGTEALIMGENYEPLPPNERGELCIRGPQVMLGYKDNFEATRDTLDNQGWLYTGDVAYCDDDGYIYVVDRTKELIKFKGIQVAPAELEALLTAHPLIAEAAVIGIPDKVAGEVPRAYVVPRPNARVNPIEVQKFVAHLVSNPKRLRGGVEVVDEIPRNLAGKILRRDLKADYMKRHYQG
ncbi:unnamed protein product [Cyprideis torosa]|uniref:Uncharacterized protein n=1 Tax=Cyprideis torosa TaxID=163714 RepID=A0A7R8ZJM0_9CRUS|nr:unnamed protein product [Cyprideis torosa]CAG0888974.1 unnamed protein product [Cyprideis torosa]